MPSLTNFLRYALLFLTFLSLSLAATPTSFCKCTCLTNSTIIPLDPPHQKSQLPDEDLPPARSCADCTKKFCLSYNLPICKDAEEEDVFTTCFQRDSTKDQVVIYVFIGTTVGLLGWAMLKPVVERWRERREYVPVGGGGGQ